jgi:hypothetical protein
VVAENVRPNAPFEIDCVNPVSDPHRIKYQGQRAP